MIQKSWFLEGQTDQKENMPDHEHRNISTVYRDTEGTGAAK